MHARSQYDEIVEIKIAERSFKVHNGIISFYSGFFDRAFNGEFAEGKNGVVTLQDEEIAVFERFIAWIYRVKIEYDEPKNYWVLCKLWCFADRREVPLLMNACLDAIRDKVAKIWLVPTAQLAYIYKNTTENAGLRRLVRDLIAKTSGPEILDSNKDWDGEMLRDLLKIVWGLKPSEELNKKQVEALDVCQYHQHEEGVKCPKKT